MSFLLGKAPVFMEGTPIFSVLKLAVFSVIAFALWITHGTILQRVTESLYPKVEEEEEKTKPEAKKQDKKEKTASLFPAIVYENFSSTNKNIVPCATGDNFNFVPIQNHNGIVGWDMPVDELSLMYDQSKITLGMDEPAVSFASSSNSTSSSPMTENLNVNGFYNANFLEMMQQQDIMQYPQQQQLPVVNYNRPRQLSNGDDSIVTVGTPPELEGVTPQHGYSSPEEGQIMAGFDQTVMFPQDRVPFLQGESQQLDNAVFGDAIATQQQMMPNGVYPVVHSRSNSNNAEDYVLDMDKANLLGSMNNEFQMPSDAYFYQARMQPQPQVPLQPPLNSQQPLHHQTSSDMMTYNIAQPFAQNAQMHMGAGFLSPGSDFTSPNDHMSSGESTDGTSNSKQQPFSCPHCPSSFRIRGYLTRHMKKHATKKAYSCPFYDPNDKTPCHPSGGFSRRDTYKTHLKARHFMYPAGTRSEHRGKVSGVCSGCGLTFDSNEKWVEEHIHNRHCPGVPDRHY